MSFLLSIYMFTLPLSLSLPTPLYLFIYLCIHLASTEARGNAFTLNRVLPSTFMTFCSNYNADISETTPLSSISTPPNPEEIALSGVENCEPGKLVAPADVKNNLAEQTDETDRVADGVIDKFWNKLDDIYFASPTNTAKLTKRSIAGVIYANLGVDLSVTLLELTFTEGVALDIKRNLA